MTAFFVLFVKIKLLFFYFCSPCISLHLGPILHKPILNSIQDPVDPFFTHLQYAEQTWGHYYSTPKTSYLLPWIQTLNSTWPLSSSLRTFCFPNPYVSISQRTCNYKLVSTTVLTKIRYLKGQLIISITSAPPVTSVSAATSVPDATSKLQLFKMMANRSPIQLCVGCTLH